MSWLGRLFGRSAPFPHTPVPAQVVTIPNDLATALRVEGVPLDDTIVALLRSVIQPGPVLPAPTVTPPGDPGAEPGAMPFWLERDDTGDARLEDALRDRVAQRRASETDPDHA